LQSRMFSVVSKTWNPVTGCLHYCTYCVTGDTLVLTSDLVWKRIDSLQIGDEIVGFSEQPIRGHRYLVKAKILNIIRRRKKRKTFLIKGKNGTVRATKDHLWLVKRKGHGKEGRAIVFRRTWQVVKWGHPIKALIKPIEPPKFVENYMKKKRVIKKWFLSSSTDCCVAVFFSYYVYLF